MWFAEYSGETTADIEKIWSQWSDVADWPAWNADLVRAEISGPFVAGSRITMIPRDGVPIELEIEEAVLPGRFVDRADLGDVVVRTLHLADSIGDGRTRVTYRMEITGPAADEMGPQIGPEISADFPEVIAALIARAEG